jgi:tetratricopeptide (TPR) repeat protein
MNLRRCFVPLQLLFLLAAALNTIGVPSALSQESITLRNGQVEQVHILGITPEGLKVQIGDAMMVQPFANLAQVTMSPPPEYTAAEAAYSSGQFRQALDLDNTVLATYRGLPTDWARQAMLMQGDIYMALGQVQQADAAYKDFQRIYPGAGSDAANVSLAGVDIANGDTDAAKAKITPVLDQALKQRNPPKAAAELYGRAFFISGKIKERAGDFPGALEDYLRAVAVFPEDRLAAAGAQAAADNLRKAHAVSVQ